MQVVPQPVLLLGAVLSEEQDFAFAFTELHEASVAHCSVFKITVDGNTNISLINFLSQFYEFAEGVSVLYLRLQLATS